jgi:uncharacterized protein YcnI
MRTQLIQFLTGGLLIAVAASASAHPSLQNKEARIGASYRAVVSIPHGCDGSATVKVRVVIPEGVIGVKPMLKPGWTITTVRGPYARSYPYYHGKTLTEGVKEVIWTGNLADDFFDDFVFSGFLTNTLTAGETLHFPTIQECEKGEARWVEIPAPGQNPHALAAPAPGLKLLPAAGKHAARVYSVGSLQVEAPWARATPGGAQVAAGYVRITNKGTVPDTLVGGSLALAGAVEVHEMTSADGVMKMRRLPSGLEIAARQSIDLKPGGYHLMFTGLKEGLKDGRTVKGSLAFAKAGTVAVEFQIAPIGAQADGADGHGHH